MAFKGRIEKNEEEDEGGFCNSPIGQILRKRLTNFGGSSQSILGFEQQKCDLHDILKNVVTSGESNSVILMGRRDCGKTTLLNNVLKEIKTEFDGNNVDDHLVMVHLNGLLQIDDRIAIKEITRQLHLENTVGDRVFGSFADNLTFLLDAFRSGDRSTKAIFFVLDEFHLFCSHRNQSLLYNLLDAVQSGHSPIAVVGLTCRLDVLEMLEKRVKSRFSHRKIHLVDPHLTFEGYVDAFRRLLVVDAAAEEEGCCDEASWNQNIGELAENKEVRDILKRLFDFSRDISTLKSFLFLPVCKATTSWTAKEAGGDPPRLTVAHLRDSLRGFSESAQLRLLDGLSVLELCLVLSARRVRHSRDDDDVLNFEMVYEEYRKLAAAHPARNHGKAVVAKAFDNLVASGLLQEVVAASASAKGLQKNYRLMHFVLDDDVIDEALKKYKGLPTDVRQWASSMVA